MWRSVLFVPCGHERALGTSVSLTPDAFIFDLEDAVGAAQFDAALGALYLRLSTPDAGVQKMVRIRPDQLMVCAAALRPHVDSGRVSHIVVPKVKTNADLACVSTCFGATCRLMAMIETPQAVLGLSELVKSPSLSGLILGPNDLTLALNAKPLEGRAELMLALQSLVLHARAAGLVALDGVYNRFDDTLGFLAEAQQGRALGFDGKTLIHPSQIDLAHRAYSPEASDIARAHAIIAAFAAEPDSGAIRLEGGMIERLHLKWAQAIIAALTSDA